ncbi:hypothetical protein O1D97_02230 [Marinomonas sp. 15G1-11]|uniref:Uncharacterized protein n=1 Tax=Marinomonas phaeophyticola TaxID=3004091 RepID=A0ABT4JQ29_9GAMM|nr:hypothetical protein [Marinomonas sp. 15G1-11]MCZ2720492.1 hypothetical protein [Marinomonas sp. 15G1-11]
MHGNLRHPFGLFCEFTENFYFVGVDSVFVPTKSIQMHAELMAKNVSKTQVDYAFC